MKKRPIAVLDSSINGFFLLNELKRSFPKEDFIFFLLDDKAINYDEEKDIEKLDMIIQDLISLDIKVLIVSCSDIAIHLIEQPLRKDIVVINLITAATSYVNHHYEQKNMILLAPEAILEESVYQKNLKFDQIYNVSADPLIKIVLEQKTKTAEAFRVAGRLLRPHEKKFIDLAIFACPALDLVKIEFHEFIPNVDIVSSNKIVSLRLQDVLQAKDWANTKRRGKTILYTSQDELKVKKLANKYDVKYKKIIKYKYEPKIEEDQDEHMA